MKRPECIGVASYFLKESQVHILNIQSDWQLCLKLKLKVKSQPYEHNGKWTVIPIHAVQGLYLVIHWNVEWENIHCNTIQNYIAMLSKQKQKLHITPRAIICNGQFSLKQFHTDFKQTLLKANTINHLIHHLPTLQDFLVQIVQKRLPTQVQ